jgi:hypothetical protein
MRDLLRNEDSFNMDGLMSKMRHHRVDDKVAFKKMDESDKIIEKVSLCHPLRLETI